MAEKKYKFSIDDIIENIPEGGIPDAGNVYDPDKEFVPLETDDEPKSYLDALNDRFSGAADFVSKVPGFLKELPPALRRAALGLEIGEDGVERPRELKYDFPEISDAPISFLKGLGKTNLTALLTSDTNEKIDILNKGYADDPRFGSEGERTVLNDGLGNPNIFIPSCSFY